MKVSTTENGPTASDLKDQSRRDTAVVEKPDPSDKPQINEKVTGYLNEEHKQRRLEIQAGKTQMENDHRNGLILTGAVWSWLATHQFQLLGLGHVVFFLPSLLIAFFLWRWHGLHQGTMVNARYLRELEEAIGADSLGWETWLETERKKNSSTANLAMPSVLFWVGLLLANLALAVLFLINSQR